MTRRLLLIANVAFATPPARAELSSRQVVLAIVLCPIAAVALVMFLGFYPIILEALLCK